MDNKACNCGHQQFAHSQNQFKCQAQFCDCVKFVKKSITCNAISENGNLCFRLNDHYGYHSAFLPPDKIEHWVEGNWPRLIPTLIPTLEEKADAAVRKHRSVVGHHTPSQPPAFIADTVNHPKHYNNHPSGIECIEIVRHLPFNLGNAIKYLWRNEDKNGIEDLKKAIWYIQDEIKLRESKKE